MKSQVEQLSDELEQKKSLLNTKMGELSKYCEDLDGERIRLETLLKQVEDEKTEVESLVIQMQEEIETKDAEASLLKETHENEIQESKGMIEKMKDQVKTLNENLEKQNKSLNGLKDEISNNQDQIDRLEKDNEQLESDCLKIQAEKAALKARLPGLLKRTELVEQLKQEIELLKSKVQEGEVYIEELEIRKKESLREVLDKFKNVYSRTEKVYQRNDDIMNQKDNIVVESMMSIISAKKYTKKIRLARLFGVLKDFVLSEENFMSFFSYIDKECSENEEGIEQMLKLFVNSYESIKQKLFELSLQIINQNPDFGQPDSKKNNLKLSAEDYSKNRVIREIIHNKFLLMSSNESGFIKDSVIKYMRRKRSGRIIQKLFRKEKQNTLNMTKSKFNSSFQKLDFCVFKAATGKSLIKEMLLKMASVSVNIKEKLLKDDQVGDTTSQDQSTIYVEFG
jgi:mRNA-degrading endonuclease HigB of HigAB toxin-antitoxin module